MQAPQVLWPSCTCITKDVTTWASLKLRLPKWKVPEAWQVHTKPEPTVCWAQHKSLHACIRLWTKPSFKRFHRRNKPSSPRLRKKSALKTLSYRDTRKQNLDVPLPYLRFIPMNKRTSEKLATSFRTCNYMDLAKGHNQQNCQAGSYTEWEGLKIPSPAVDLFACSSR